MGGGIELSVGDQVGFEQLFSSLLAMEANRVKRDFFCFEIIVRVEQVAPGFGKPLFGEPEVRISEHRWFSLRGGPWR